MNIYKLLGNMTRYLSEGAVRIFSPSDDSYPRTGVQPYSGERFHGHRRADW